MEATPQSLTELNIQRLLDIIKANSGKAMKTLEINWSESCCPGEDGKMISAPIIKITYWPPKGTEDIE